MGQADDERARFMSAMELVDRALDLPADARERLLADADPDLRDHVERLLAADARDGDLLSQPAGSRVPSALYGVCDTTPTGIAVGALVGPFRLCALIGRGGMGEVWTAERVSADFEQKVAIKLLKGGAGLSSSARFRRERQILARLEHPRIARLLDGGITSDGQPWIAMELVTGLSLVEHCVEARLDVSARLALFVEVCEAVQFAHQNLIVHRDLKPSNILVDERGAPKLLDFGIAKLVEHDDGVATSLTVDGERPMTPDYASPEQLRDGPITTASDVWTLGSILHELLTGERVDRSLLDTGKGRPSVCVAAGESRNRPSDLSSAALKSRLKGDLDAIVLKAMRTDPADRYGSVDALAEDVRRHLEGVPVAARGGATAYLLRSFVRRHRVGAGLSGLVVLALVVGLLGTLWQAHRAREEARKASQTREFLVTLLEGFDPYAQGGKPVTQHDILLRGEARLGELDGQPEVQAELLRIFARTWINMGELERARPPVDRALTLQRRVLGPRHIEVAKTLLVLGELSDIPGNWEDAERAYAEALSIAREVEGPEGPTALVALGAVAYVARGHGDFALSEKLYREQLALHTRLHGDESREALETRGDLASMLCDAGRLDESETLSRAVALLDARVFGDDHPGTLIVRGNLARALIELGRNGEADVILRDVYPRQVSVVGPQSPYALNTLRLRARALDGLGRAPEAIVLLDEVLREQTRLRGEQSVEVVRTLGPRAIALRHLGRLPEAEGDARRAIAILAPRRTERHTVARLRSTLGSVLLDEGRVAEARAELASAFAVEEEVLSPTHHDLRTTRAELARADLARP